MCNKNSTRDKEHVSNIHKSVVIGTKPKSLTYVRIFGYKEHIANHSLLTFKAAGV